MTKRAMTVAQAIRSLSLGAGEMMEVRIGRGEHPSRTDLATLLRSDDNIPGAVRAYIAGIVDGSIKLPRGKPKASPHELRLQQLVRTDALERAAHDVRRFQRVWKIRRNRTRGVFDKAVEWASKKWRVDAEALRDYIRRGRAKR